MVKKSAKGSLIVGVLVDVGDYEFGLPQECMIRTFENLSLLDDRMNNDLQCRTPICRLEGAGIDFGADLRDSSSYRTTILQSFLPYEPHLIHRAGISAPALHQCASTYA